MINLTECHNGNLRKKGIKEGSDIQSQNDTVLECGEKICNPDDEKSVKEESELELNK